MSFHPGSQNEYPGLLSSNDSQTYLFPEYEPSQYNEVYMRGNDQLYNDDPRRYSCAPPVLPMMHINHPRLMLDPIETEFRTEHRFFSPRSAHAPTPNHSSISTPVSPGFGHPQITSSPDSPYYSMGHLTSASSQADTSLDGIIVPVTSSVPLYSTSPIYRAEDRSSIREVNSAWKRVIQEAVIITGPRSFVPQTIYRPHTQSDMRRYVEEAPLMPVIYFKSEYPEEWGISLDDALRLRTKCLIDKDDPMFENCGPSVSIRLQWPGYRSWSKQIPTKDFRTPKCPITRAKLAKNIARCAGRFMEEMQDKPMEEDGDDRWRIGPHHIRFEDIVLVSLHHVSQGSWQPQLRLKRLL